MLIWIACSVNLCIFCLVEIRFTESQSKSQPVIGEVRYRVAENAVDKTLEV